MGFVRSGGADPKDFGESQRTLSPLAMYPCTSSLPQPSATTTFDSLLHPFVTPSSRHLFPQMCHSFHPRTKAKQACDDMRRVRTSRLRDLVYQTFTVRSAFSVPLPFLTDG